MRRPPLATAPPSVVVMGVAGSGKTSVADALAARLDLPFIDGDDLHPAENVAKMSAGQPLDDHDRWPWLARVRHALRSQPTVIACSALRRRYRDFLRQGAPVVFIHLELDPETAVARLQQRPGHFMGAGMVESQFAALERPGSEEHDVASVDATADRAGVLDSTMVALADLRPGTAVEPLLADGGSDRHIGAAELEAHVEGLVQEHIIDAGKQRVLLVPPDHTRLHSRAGPITAAIATRLRAAGVDVGVMPALGTHVPMTAGQVEAMFGGVIPHDEVIVHDWRRGLRALGTIAPAEVAAVTADRLGDGIDIAVSEELFAGWDLVVSIGQVVPHEVIGMANATKNLVIGLGGPPTIHRTHYLGALVGMESIMGRPHGPVRDVVDAAFDRFIAREVDVLWLLTVIEDLADGDTIRGFYAGLGGAGSSGRAAYEAAAALAQDVNVEITNEPHARMACWLDPAEFHSTWLGNKAIYRTRMAMADDGELIVLAPGVGRLGEDPEIDAQIRRHGYRSTRDVMAAVAADPDLEANLAAAAHLIHGSSEGRFRIVYCTDPDAGGLSREEIEAVGYEWRPLRPELARLGVDGGTPTGHRSDAEGQPFFHVANAALGLWAWRGRFS